MHQVTLKWTFNSQGYRVYTKYLPKGPNFVPFPSTARRFLDIRLSKIGNAPNGIRLTLHLMVKSTSYTLSTYHCSQNSPPFIWSITSRFQDIAHCIIIPHWLRCQTGKTKQNRRSKNFAKLENSFNNFGGDPHTHEQIWHHLKLLLPYGPMLTKTKKKNSKISNFTRFFWERIWYVFSEEMSFEILFLHGPMLTKKKKTRGPRTLALCLTAAVRMTLAIFCRLVSKTHLCRLNQLKSGLNSHKVPHCTCINFRSYSTT